ncbi:GNAT family N-acetyltransferase [Klebsiella sp. BIGb0407]|uniref:GNAT family N-acetyltransferase n=1 Tax=Klebsiella sp. BIGb0407 TaxID=2940603 RepID=UPI00216859A0|nr:GNAT family N-acetyltransferase [Klebsiella sp. BIGb0407]MCS3432283.1 GNAT superfamily N-acetyltransferase [Klebsiella sp. BIGb0407]
MQDTISCTTAAHWNSYQLAAILTSCFEGYLTPFTIQGDVFSARFAAEDVSLNDSLVWLQQGQPVALALIARRGQTSRLAAFAIRPALRGQGLGKYCIQQLIDAARERGDKTLSLEVIVGNESGIALYQRMGFTLQQSLIGFHAPLLPTAPSAGELTEIDPLYMARKMMVDPHHHLPWLTAAETLYKLPGKAYALNDVAYGMVIPGEPTKLRMLYVEPEARGRGEAKALLMLLREKFGYLSTAVAIPESLSPLFLTCGFIEEPIKQYEMSQRLLP